MTTSKQLLTGSGREIPESGRCMPEKKPLGIYIHIPFCLKKCAYCDFISFEGTKEDAHAAYVKRMIREISERAERARGGYFVDSIYIGGGTPSIIAPQLIEELLAAVRSVFHCNEDAEVTIEVNPGAVREGALAAYRRAGINRVSVGIQSFDPAVLATLGRIHDAEAGELLCRELREAGFDNISMDLMFGIPGQTPESQAKDVRRVIELSPAHISFYSLSVEEGTPLQSSIEKGTLSLPSEETDRAMYRYARESFTAAGYEHYELSNCSRPGMESLHNLKYWALTDYLGFGVAAHSYFDGIRFSNTEDPGAYLASRDTHGMLAYIHENSKRDDMSEYVWLGLRRLRGIETDDFARRFGVDFSEVYGAETDKLIGQGLLVCNGNRLRLSELGCDVANMIFAEYV